MDNEITVTKENTRFFPQHSHLGWEYMLYTKGRGRLVTEVGEYSFCPGMLIAIPPRLRHGSCADEPFVNICIHSETIPFERQNEIFVLEKADDEIKLLFELVRKLYFNEDFQNDSILPLISLLSKLLSRYKQLPESERMVKELHEYIAENFQSLDCDIVGFVDRYGYSDDYSRTRFKRKYGLTPHDYLEKLRMEYAEKLLSACEESLKVRDIAALCGFEDPLYFSRRFKRYFDHSPKSVKGAFAEAKAMVDKQ